MRDATRRVMCEAIDAMATSLAWGYTDSTHDEFDFLCDRLRHAYVTEEAEMNNETPPTLFQFLSETYGADHAEAMKSSDPSLF